MAALPTIALLPDRVINQIAAGEVVERPVSVVKELVENSLDAGATKLEIEFRQGGKSLIRIADNGHGMTAEQARLALQRHATSKLRDVPDLDHLHTFGFRGEALPSIASVSRFTLRTKAAGQPGWEIIVNGGKVVVEQEVGTPVGTTIEVVNLFAPVPARRKFLKSDATEAAHIIQWVRLLAVAHPEVSFSLIEDGRPLWQSPVCQSLRDRVREVFGRELENGMLEVSGGPAGADHPGAEGARVFGLVMRPGQGRATRNDLHCFVNRRPVDSRTLVFALMEAYHTYVPKGRYPSVFLFVELDPRQVDVNVHPAKREVRFRDEGALRRFVMLTVMETLRRAPAAGAAASVSADLPERLAAPPAVSSRPTVLRLTEADTSAQRAASRLLDGKPAAATPSASPTGASNSHAPSAPSAHSPAAAPAATPPAPKPVDPTASVASPPAATAVGRRETPPTTARGATGWRCLGLAHRSLAIFETPAGILFLQVRAARERLLYEQIRQQLSGGAPQSQGLLFPVTIELDPLAAVMVEEQRPILEHCGYEISAFGRTTYRIEAIPEWLEMADAENFARDLIALWRERQPGRVGPGKSPALLDEVARLGAIRAARTEEPLDLGALEDLANRLLACPNPHADPAGRPILWEIPQGDWERRFGRTN